MINGTTKSSGDERPIVVEIGKRLLGFGCLTIVIGVPVMVFMSALGVAIIGRAVGWW